MNADSEGGGEVRPVLFQYTQTFEREFPYYLSIGMTTDEYWNQDCTLVVAFRKAEELRRKRKNEESWLQGMYIYDALQRLTPIFQAFPKKGAEPMRYVEEPYPLDNDDVKEQEERREQVKANKGKAYMEAYMEALNKTYEGGVTD